MLLSFKRYRDKVNGCWMGKNIGGALGAPFEGIRQINHVEFYAQDLNGNPPANDDLDLQLVWLNAVEQFGRDIDARILGEYWLSFIIPDWGEYGAGKNNLRRGLLPPLSGWVENVYRESNGCFIRSEIWACLAPGRPELAVRYAYEDAIVDHGGEGVYAEAFCAAVESAAFVESEPLKLIDIGLSYIPTGSGVAKGVQTAIAAYKAHKTWEEARKDVLEAVPGCFGIQCMQLKDIKGDLLPIGTPGYDAPSNIGLIIVGWLYGEGDFGKTICITNNCGEDTDCTCATIGAILGIIGGIGSIPEKWRQPIGDAISTCCINPLNGGLKIPKTVTELTERILRETPVFLGPLCDILAGPDGYTIKVLPPDELYCVSGEIYINNIGYGNEPEPQIPELLRKPPYVVRFRFPVFNVELDYVDGPFIRPGVGKKLRLTVTDSIRLNSTNNQWISVRWYLPDGVSIKPGRESSFFMKTTYHSRQVAEFEITAEDPGGKVELIADISAQGRHSNGLVKATLIPSF